jgi:hypothetical protein
VSARDVAARHYTVNFDMDTSIEFDAVVNALQRSEVTLISRS